MFLKKIDLSNKKLFQSAIVSLNQCFKLNSFSSPLKKLPSPPTYPIIGHAYLFTRNGPYSKEKFTEAVADLSTKYGPIFLLKFPGQNLVITTDAENALKLFQNEGKHPTRDGMSALEYYHKRNFNTVGVVSGNGETWYKLRKCLTPLLTKNYISKFNVSTNEIARNFVDYIRTTRNEKNIVYDICTHLYRYSTECISVVSPGKRLHCLNKPDQNDKSCLKLIQANSEFMDGLYKTFSEPPFWKIMKTTGFKKIEKSYGVLTEYIGSVLDQPTNEWKNSFAKVLLENSNLSKNEARLLSIEIFLGGIDAVATTIAMTLHYLSRNEYCQELAFEGVSENSHSYLKACLKETLRLSSSAGGTSRVIPVDMMMNGYLIPAETTILVMHSVTSRMEKYFEAANLFKPERWLHKEKLQHKDPYSNYASLPFGYGARVCPGRWLSEQESLLLLTEILKEFKLVSATDSPVGMVCRMNRMPDQPINIRFTDRLKT